MPCMQSIEDVIAGGYTVCVQNSLVENTVVALGEKIRILETDSVDASLLVWTGNTHHKAQLPPPLP